LYARVPRHRVAVSIKLKQGAHRGRGFARLYDDDHEQLAAASVVYDALYAYCQQSLAEAR
jgi:hypothetical protein